MTTLVSLAESLEQTRLGTMIAESRYAFPFIEGVHLIGLSIAVGLLFLTDLRLMGLFLKKVPVKDVLRNLQPWVLGGFGVIFVTGTLLFVAEASTLIESPAFAIKLVFIVVAGINALYFEFVTAKQQAVQENWVVLPKRVRYAGAASIGLWTLVIICGRLIPYIPSWS